MLALGVGNAWGAEKTITLTYSDFGLTTSYAQKTATVDGIGFTVNQGYKGSGNVIQMNSSKGAGVLYNTTSIAGLKSITVNVSSGSKTYTITSGTAQTPSGNSQTGTATKTFSIPSGDTYFQLKVSGASYFSSIVITYDDSNSGGETPGTGGETPEPEPEPGTGGTGTINFNSNAVKIKAASVTGDDNLGNTWTITTVGTTSFTASNAYYQVGSSSKPATSITFTTTLPSEGNITAFSAKFGGFGGTAGAVTLKVDDTSVGTGSLNATSDVTISNSSQATGKKLTVTVTGIAKGVKVYYISYTYTTSSGGSEPETPETELTDAQFAWPAATAEATMGASNTFPTLTNTLSVPVTYESSTPATATIAADGTITLVAPGKTTISAKFAGGEVSGTTYAAKTVKYDLTVLKAPAAPTENMYVKVTNAVTDGEYLIVYEDGKVAFNGALTTLDAESNTVEVVINSNTIAGNTDIDAATFTINVTDGTILSASGYYIGQTSDANGLKANTTTQYENVLTIENDGSATIKSGGAYLRYNSDANQWRFRYYKSSSYSGQKAIALYKKASKHTVTIAGCTNGSVSAKMGETSLATNDQVLSGIQITLSNEAAASYKLAAYNVYKTGDATTKVTVTDGKFIMPEFDVTISATFELAKTLNSIEITNPATQTTFWQGEAFKYDGLKVTAHFDGAADEDVTDKVIVTGSTTAAGTVAVEVSFTEGTTTKTTSYNITVKAIPNTKETAYSVADAYDIIDKLTTANGVFIKGVVSQVDSYNSTYKSITYWISADGTTTEQLEVYSGKGLENANFADKTDLAVGDQVIVCGNLKKYDGIYEFDKNNYLVEHVKTTKADPELSYTTAEYNVNLGEAFTAPTLNNPHTLAVIYSSSNEDVATVAADGAVTIKAAGTVKITASFAGNDDYVAGEASYTINITDPSISEATFVVNVEKGDKSITKNDITVEVSDGDLSREDNYRCYANQSMTISYSDGQITKIVITCTGSGTANYGPGKLSTEDGGYSYSDKVGTWTGEAKSVTFAASAQVRMTAITVYYKQDKRANAELEWSEESVNLTVGDEFTAPTFNNPNHLAPISFVSDNSAVATVNNAGEISLKAGAVGSAIITATFAGNETYKDAEVSCTITVNPKTEDVVIVAQREGKWYALKAEVGSSNNSLAALEVEYINGVLYNVADEDKASITWKRTVVGNLETFQYGDKYLKGNSSTNLFMEEGAEGKYQWDKNTHTMLIGTSNRTFLYQGTYFKNYAISNAGKTIDGTTYSALPVVTTAKFENATIITRSDLTVEDFGTICYENNITNFIGATFFNVVGKDGRKVIFDEVTELEAGMPYIFRAEAEELKIVLGNETATSAGKHNSLQGTFEGIVPAETNTLTGNYIIYNNLIKKCGKNCGLNPNRAYFIAAELQSLPAAPAPMPGRRRVAMGYEEENQATGVDNITENGAITPALQGTYDIMGRQLSEPTATGFYIVNGKKVFVVK